MSKKQACLIAAVKDAMEAQGIKGVDLARASGQSASMISMALSGSGQMKDEKWRLVCDFLHLDFDEIVADIETASPEMLQNIEHKEPENESLPEKMDCIILASYAAKHLQEDIKQGIDIKISDLRILLNAIDKYLQPA